MMLALLASALSGGTYYGRSAVLSIEWLVGPGALFGLLVLAPRVVARGRWGYAVLMFLVSTLSFVVMVALSQVMALYGGLGAPPIYGQAGKMGMAALSGCAGLAVFASQAVVEGLKVSRHCALVVASTTAVAGYIFAQACSSLPVDFNTDLEKYFFLVFIVWQMGIAAALIKCEVSADRH